MNQQNLELAKGLVDAAYIEQGRVELSKRETLVRILLSQRCLPDIGWDDDSIRLFLSELSAMDSNNFSGSVGAGEREARIYSKLVRDRHFGMGHGIGRSGDIAAVQPKAAGSSLIYTLTNKLSVHAIKLCGITRCTSALVLPSATGMSLSLCLAALRAGRGQPAAARYVVWSRIDQKSCYKCIATAGLTPLVVPPVLVGDELHTDVEGIRAAILSCPGGAPAVVAVLTTTSCFAPRAPDDVQAVARLCAELDVPHLVNNAYGLQSSKICHEINEAMRGGGELGRGEGGRAYRVDAVVSSTDKNFLVPVGAALVYAAHSTVVEAVSSLYPGRASASPVVDLFITLLSMGKAGLQRALAQRKEVYGALKERLAALAAVHGERLLSSPRNPISLAMSIGTITGAIGVGVGGSTAPPLPATYLGSMLFSRGVSGTRVVSCGESKSMEGVHFLSYGASMDGYPSPYLTSAAAMGMTREEAEVYVDRLGRCIVEYKKQAAAKASKKGETGSGNGDSAACATSPPV